MAETPENLYLISFSLIILMKIICFVLGYKTIKLGYNLISSGVKGEFKFSSTFAGFKADLVSISPGLLFVLLGIMLIMIAIYTNKNVTYHNIKTSNPISKDSVQKQKPVNPIPMSPPDTTEVDSLFH